MCPCAHLAGSETGSVSAGASSSHDPASNHGMDAARCRGRETSARGSTPCPQPWTRPIPGQGLLSETHFPPSRSPLAWVLRFHPLEPRPHPLYGGDRFGPVAAPTSTHQKDGCPHSPGEDSLRSFTSDPAARRPERLGTCRLHWDTPT